MCCGCWEESGSPRVDSPAVRAAVAAIRESGLEDICGGHLHIVLDDWNTEDDNLDFCAGEIEANDDGCPASQIAAERYVLGLLRNLTIEERDSALGIIDGCWTPEVAS